MRRLLLVLALLLLVAAGTVLPVWRILDLHGALSNAASLGIARGAGRPAGVYLVPLLFVALAVATAALWRRRARLARFLYGAALVGALFAVFWTVRDVAVRRSRAVNDWPVCETGRTLWGSEWPSYGRRASVYDGPHLPSGQPCIAQAEQREVAAQESPDGAFVDGLRQVALRFRADRPLVFWGGGLSLLALAVGALIFRAAAAAPAASSSTPATAGRPAPPP